MDAPADGPGSDSSNLEGILSAGQAEAVESTTYFLQGDLLCEEHRVKNRNSGELLVLIGAYLDYVACRSE